MSNKRARQTESDDDDDDDEEEEEEEEEKEEEERSKRKQQSKSQPKKKSKGKEQKKSKTKHPTAIYQKIAEDLKEWPNFIDMDDYQMEDIKSTNGSYISLISHGLKQDDSEEGKIDMIQAGISEALLFLFENWEMEDLDGFYSDVFYQLTQGDGKNKHQLLYEDNPFPGLTRLFEHEEDEVVLDAIRSITNIVVAGYRTVSGNKPHPYFNDMIKDGVVKDMYDLFNVSKDEAIKDQAAISIGIVYKAQEIDDTEMKTEIIDHLKSIVKETEKDEQILDNAKTALKSLSLNKANNEEIKKNDFAIPN